MKKTLFLSILVTALFLTSATYSQAATTKPSPSPVATTSPTPQETPAPASPETTAQKLRELIQKGTERVKGAMDTLGAEKRMFIGDVQRVTDKTVTIKSFKRMEILTINEDTPILKDSKKISIDDIAIGDWAAAIGTTNKDLFTLKRLFVSSSSLLPKNLITTIVSVKTVSKTQISATPRNSQTANIYKITKDTLYQDNQGNKMDIKLVKPDYQYLLVGYQDETGTTLTIVRSLGI